MMLTSSACNAQEVRCRDIYPRGRRRYHLVLILGDGGENVVKGGVLGRNFAGNAVLNGARVVDETLGAFEQRPGRMDELGGGRRIWVPHGGRELENGSEPQWSELA